MGLLRRYDAGEREAVWAEVAAVGEEIGPLPLVLRAWASEVGRVDFARWGRRSARSRRGCARSDRLPIRCRAG